MTQKHGTSFNINTLYETNNDVGGLEPWNQQNGFQIPSFTTVPYYINVGGPGAKSGWANRAKTAMGRLKGPMKRSGKVVDVDAITFCIVDPLYATPLNGLDSFKRNHSPRKSF